MADLNFLPTAGGESGRTGVPASAPLPIFELGASTGDERKCGPPVADCTKRNAPGDADANTTVKQFSGTYPADYHMSQGSEEFWERFVKKLPKSILDHLYKRSKNEVRRYRLRSYDSQDLLHDAMLRVMRRRHQVPTNAEEFDRVMCTTMRSLASHRKRHELREILCADSFSRTDTTDAVEFGKATDDPERTLLAKASLFDELLHVPDPLSRVICLCEMAGFSARETQAILEIDALAYDAGRKRFQRHFGKAAGRA